MPDLKDGQSVDVQGSAAQPYVLKNVGGVYSCSCPAWRNQSLPIERRTCKHLRAQRGDAAETARVGAVPTRRAGASHPKPSPPRLLLAQTWDGRLDPAGWWLGEKLDGVRASWDGRQFLSRQGNRYHAPDWFTAGLPGVPLDGELWVGRRQFQRTVGIVRRHDRTDLWRAVRFLVFDAPGAGGGFEDRLRLVAEYLAEHRPEFARAHPHAVCAGVAQVRAELASVEALGGEGLMLRQPGSPYVAGRSPTLLKVKSFRDAEARVVGHQPGAGRHQGRLGALLVELANGARCAVGTGLSDAERERPPAVGTVITLRYQELSDRGVPRFPVYAGIREDIPSLLNPNEEGITAMSANSATPRRFEYVGGGSDKFWEVEVQDVTVTVRFGRNGTCGQTQTKTFPTEAAARKHADTLVRAKTGKGYVEAG
jgi:DNA ligase-1